MQDTQEAIAELGNQPPLIADGRSGPPDRREVSTRWLSGTFLTGLTSSVLMGVALFAALDGRQQLATPPEIAELIGLAGGAESGEGAKTTRLVPLTTVIVPVGSPGRISSPPVIQASPLQPASSTRHAAAATPRNTEFISSPK